MTAAEVIEKLGLVPLPGEGGYYRETYRSAYVACSASDSANTSHRAMTAIYYLLTPETYSALHRLKHDEIYFFHAGDPVEMTLVMPDGECRSVTLSSSLDDGAVCQMLVPGGTWQGSRLSNGGSWGLVSTVVCPGFEFTDCELASRARVKSWDQAIRRRVEHLLPTENR